jgi:hypothetical protein
VLDPGGLPDLQGAGCDDASLLRVFHELTHEHRGSTCRRRELASLRVEELGRAQEHMLALQPVIALQSRPSFALIPGNARKEKGVYYTPRELIDKLTTSILDPLIGERLAAESSPDGKQQALLRLRVCDPACGSGYFLLAAGRRIAAELARVRAGRNRSQADAYPAAIGEVVKSCLFGIDASELAVELCKMALWLECEQTDLRFDRFDHHIRWGNSLIGVIDLSVVEGVPGGGTSASQNLHVGSSARAAQCDRWTAQFFPRPNKLGESPSIQEAREQCVQHGAVHWPLEFPEIWARGGFDVVFSNPPWELLQPEEVEFFRACGREDIARLPGAQRKHRIRQLSARDPQLEARWMDHKRQLEREGRFMRRSGRYPLTSQGKLNLSSAFLETIRKLLHREGRAGCIVPSGFATDDATKRLFQDLLSSRALLRMYHFDNRGNLFPAVGRCVTFCLIELAGPGYSASRSIEFAFFLHRVEELNDPARRFALSADDVELLNPNTRTCPIFGSQRDAELTKAIYQRVPVLLNERRQDGNPWQITFRQGLYNMTSDSHLFRTRSALERSGWHFEGNVAYRNGQRCVPLYEAKMLHHFDHRWGSFQDGGKSRLKPPRREDPCAGAIPRYWVLQDELDGRLSGRWAVQWLLGCRLICRSTDKRTVIGTILPPVAAGNSVVLLFPAVRSARRLVALTACLNSFALDYVARQKLGGINLNFHVLKQLPVFAPEAYEQPAPWCRSQRLGDWITRRVLELVYTCWDLQPFARDLGYIGPPFIWDVARRSLLRSELDAAFFRLYGMTEAEVAYVMDSFVSLRRQDEKQHGEYRIKRLILDAFAALPGSE